MITIEELSAMSDEERAAYERKLIFRGVGNIFLVQAVKFALIIGVTRALKKALA